MGTGDGELSLRRSKPESGSPFTRAGATLGSTSAVIAVAVGSTRGTVVGVRQHTTHTRTPGSLTNVQCSHCQLDSDGGGAGPRPSASTCSAVVGRVGVGSGTLAVDGLGIAIVRPGSRVGVRIATGAGTAARSLSLSLSESASLDGNGGGEGVRCLVRRDVRDRTLMAGDAAREPVRDATRDTPRLSPKSEWKKLLPLKDWFSNRYWIKTLSAYLYDRTVVYAASEGVHVGAYARDEGRVARSRQAVVATRVPNRALS